MADLGAVLLRAPTFSFRFELARRGEDVARLIDGERSIESRCVSCAVSTPPLAAKRRSELLFPKQPKRGPVCTSGRAPRTWRKSVCHHQGSEFIGFQTYLLSEHDIARHKIAFWYETVSHYRTANLV